MLIIPEEESLLQQGLQYCGVDEAGAGPLCGDVLAAAAILDPSKPIPGLNDSKKLSEKKREALYELICDQALAYSIARATVKEIDDINILNARMLAMSRAVGSLAIKAEFALIDGNKLPVLPCPALAIVKGDSKVQSIAAASILAKVARDREMIALDSEYPGYGFAKHKGYGTAQHLQALDELGPCPAHRVSYAPVKRAKANWDSRACTD